MNAAISYLAVVLVVVLSVTESVDGAYTCYSCNSNNPVCGASAFSGVTTIDGCTCCTKTVTDSGYTTRDCGTLMSTNCIPLPNHYVCASDKCNSATTASFYPLLLLALVSTAGLFVNLLQ